jgi:hypothetical protein
MHSITKDQTSVFANAQPIPYRHSCGSADVRHSHRKGWIIKMAKRLGYEAFRCRACGKRFFKSHKPRDPPDELG